MLTLLGNLDSGNVHKVQMLLARKGLTFRRVDVRQDRGDTRDARFLTLNPMGKVPTVVLEDGDVLTDSGALLFYFAQGTPLWPSAPREQAEVLRWMFFEQYNHEPALAVLRYLLRFSGETTPDTRRAGELRSRSAMALDVMAGRLDASDWITGATPTIADYALFPSTSLAPEIGMDLSDWPPVDRWLSRMTTLPGFLPVYSDAASEVCSKAEFFGPSPAQ